VGWLTHTRRGGVAVAPSEEAAHAWFNHLHLKDFPTLVDDPDVQREVGAFVRDSVYATTGGWTPYSNSTGCTC